MGEGEAQPPLRVEQGMLILQLDTCASDWEANLAVSSVGPAKTPAWVSDLSSILTLGRIACEY